MSKMKTYFIPIVYLLTLSACKHTECDHVYDDVGHERIFQKCLETMANQPMHNHEDNNGHIVDACNDAARQITTRFVCKEVP